MVKRISETRDFFIFMSSVFYFFYLTVFTVQSLGSNWVILDGEWEWWIEDIGTQRVKKHDIIVVPRGVWHKITCVGDSPGVRYAVTRPDVEHVYEDD